MIGGTSSGTSGDIVSYILLVRAPGTIFSFPSTRISNNSASLSSGSAKKWCIQSQL